MSRKAAVVSGAGWISQLAINLDAARQAAGLREEDIHILGTPEGEEYFGKLIEALGSSKMFFALPWTPIEDRGSAAVLIRRQKNQTRKEMISLMQKEGYRPASAVDLDHFRKNHFCACNEYTVISAEEEEGFLRLVEQKCWSQSDDPSEHLWVCRLHTSQLGEGRFSRERTRFLFVEDKRRKAA